MLLSASASRLAMLAGLALLAGCAAPGGAGSAPPSEQVITLKTEPTGAQCSLQRNGQALPMIEAAPQQVTVSQSRRDIAVLCRLAGYQDTAATLESTVIETTAAHLLLYGMGGMVARTAAGQFNRYPEEMTVAMRPVAFPDAAARDNFLAARKAELAIRAAATERRIAHSCPTPDFCRMERDNAEAEQRTLVAKLDADIAAIPVQ